MDHPGTTLKRRFLDPIGLTPYALAHALGVQQTRLSQLIHGRRGITPDTAVRLGAFFGVPPRWFLDIQADWELERAAAVGREVTPLSAPDVLVTPQGARRIEPAAPRPATPVTHRADDALRRRLEAQVDLVPKRTPREVHEVRYANGMRGIVGLED